MTSGRKGKHKAILLDDPNVTTGVTSVLNSATLLPSLSKKEILQNCLEAVVLRRTVRQMQDTEQLRSSYGAEVVAAVLPAPPSLHTELIALPRALILSKGERN